jgi:threonine dehydrogenase-like Zn-dependent dehydrogenase
MRAARLHGPSDLRLEEVPHPGPPGRGQVLLRVRATGLCGSDLHSYLDARIGATGIPEPLMLGHEFSGVIEEAGPDALDGNFEPVQAGTRVAVDPAQPCGQCSLCREGLTLLLSRRIKHAYPRALRLAQSGRVDLLSLVSHRFPLERAAEAFQLSTQYRDNVTKVIIDLEP